ncbi:unnamed protein product [Gadus morhua 'NCC']
MKSQGSSEWSPDKYPDNTPVFLLFFLRCFFFFFSSHFFVNFSNRTVKHKRRSTEMQSTT